MGAIARCGTEGGNLVLILHGHAVCSGAAVGRLRFYRHGRVSAQLRHVEDAGQEIERLRKEIEAHNREHTQGQK